jgi:hypothetical protein
MARSCGSFLLTLCRQSALKWYILFARNRTTWNLLQIKLSLMNQKAYRGNIFYILFHAVQLPVRRYIFVFAHLSITNVSACSILLLFYLNVEFQYVEIVHETHDNLIVLYSSVIRMMTQTIIRAHLLILIFYCKKEWTFILYRWNLHESKYHKYS